MPERCPYCYRNLGTFAHDPILLPNGAKYDWDMGVENTLVEMELEDRWYQGFQQISKIDIKELQDDLKTLEEENLPEGEWTDFSPVTDDEDTGIFQVKGLHIKELRESVEKLLDYFIMTKQEYFNYDEEDNHIISPAGDKTNWTDDIVNEEDWNKFQVKAIHIEDLRHYIRQIRMEKWNISPVGIPEKGGGHLVEDPEHPGWWNWVHTFFGDIAAWTPDWTDPYPLLVPPSPPLYWVKQRLPADLFSSFEIKLTGENKYAEIKSMGGVAVWYTKNTVFPLYADFGWKIGFPPTSLGMRDFITPRPLPILESKLMSFLINVDYARNYVGYTYNYGGAKHDWVSQYPRFNITFNFRIYDSRINPEEEDDTLGYAIWTIKYDSEQEVNETGAMHHVPDVGLVYGPPAAPGATETRNLVTLDKNTDIILTWDFWNLLVQYYINTYNEGLDGLGQKIPAHWELRTINFSVLPLGGNVAHSGGGLPGPGEVIFDTCEDGFLKFNLLDNIGLIPA